MTDDTHAKAQAAQDWAATTTVQALIATNFITAAIEEMIAAGILPTSARLAIRNRARALAAEQMPPDLPAELRARVMAAWAPTGRSDA